VTLEGEVDLVDAMALRDRAEGCLGTSRTSAEEDAGLALHFESSFVDPLSDHRHAVKRRRPDRYPRR
jgi:hypothetical protein